MTFVCTKVIHNGHLCNYFEVKVKNHTSAVGAGLVETRLIEIKFSEGPSYHFHMSSARCYLPYFILNCAIYFGCHDFE